MDSRDDERVYMPGSADSADAGLSVEEKMGNVEEKIEVVEEKAEGVEVVKETPVTQDNRDVNRYAYNAYAPGANDHVWQPSKEPEVNYRLKKKQKARISFATIMICLVMCLTVTAANIGGMYYLINEYLPQKYMAKSGMTISSTLGGNSNTTVNRTEGEYTVKEIANMVLPAVVAITSTSYITQGNNPFSGGYTYQVTGAGSGIIIGQSDTELLIVTNDHVVEDTTELTIEFIDGESYSAYVKGTKSNCDIAVVAVKMDELSSGTLTSIKIATLGDSNTLQVGDGVVAIGNALGYGQSVTDGIVSALNREVSTETYTMDMIQTNAAINGGNSGGALINMYGEVIGINAAKTSSSGSSTSASVEGMGYAIPITDVIDVIEDIKNSETKEPVSEKDRGYLGISVIDLTDYDITLSKVKSGVKVYKVYSGGGAEAAGIYAGDIITAIDGEGFSNMEEMSAILQYYRAGETVTLTVMANVGRGKYEKKDIEVVLKKSSEINDN